MFKVGDKVVAISNQLHGGIRVVQEIINGQQLVFKHDGFHKSLCRHATTEEIAAGHRIYNDMGDDSHIENHISPLCKVEVK
ncbi:hypothetical protein PY247_12865 [Acinetobacter proteolyticus]|nr:hypothetical protein [Acinetobacter proteolyticus]WEI17382.1 hypothetical protein PY247_12865 [Acinetobacter proteolyticus]